MGSIITFLLNLIKRIFDPIKFDPIKYDPYHPNSELGERIREAEEKEEKNKEK